MKYWLLSLVLAVSAVAAPSNILNVSYDVTREFYQEYNDGLRASPTKSNTGLPRRSISLMAGRANRPAPSSMDWKPMWSR